MSSDTSPATENTSTESSSGTPQTAAARFLTGGCICKSIRYKIARDECQERMAMSICHCGACQAFTSSAFSIGLVVPAPAFELSDPAHLLKTYEDEDPATMAGNRIAFCGKCGCYLMHEPVFPLVRRDLFIRHSGNRESENYAGDFRSREPRNLMGTLPGPRNGKVSQQTRGYKQQARARSRRGGANMTKIGA